MSLLRCPFPPLLFFVWWRTPQEEEKMSGKKQQTNGGDDRKDQHQEYQRGGSQRGSRGKDGGGGKKGRNYDYPQFRNQKPVDKDIPLKFNYPSAASSSPSPSPSPSSSSSSSSSQRTPHITQNYFYDQFETVCSSSEETSFVELLDSKPFFSRFLFFCYLSIVFFCQQVFFQNQFSWSFEKEKILLGFVVLLINSVFFFLPNFLFVFEKLVISSLVLFSI